MTQQTSTAVKAAALLMVAPALLFPIKAAGQQVAINASRTVDEIVAECSSAHKPNQGAIAECIVRRGGQENRRATAEANARVDAGEREASCGNDIKTGIGAGTFQRERLKAILAGRPAKEVGLCRILAQLQN